MKIAPLAAAVALAALVVAGCGGDNKNAVTTTTGGAATTAAASSATTRGASATTSGAGDSTTAPSFSGSGNNEFCQRARDLEGSDIANALSGEGDLKATLQGARSALNDLKGSAPSEIKDDVNTLAAAFDKLD